MIVPDSFELPHLDDAVAGASLGDVDERTIFDFYYDTADWRLARWGCTLHHRVGEGWTVKIPSPTKGAILDREEVVFAGPAGDPPLQALDVVSSLTRAAEVHEVARCATRRLARTWFTEDDVAVAKLTDDHVHVSTAEGEAVSLRELEVELAPDTDGDMLTEVITRLSAAGGAVEDAVPKQTRVLGPAAMGPPDVDVTPLSADPTAREVIRSALATSVSRLLLQLPAARLGTDPEGVHQTRVACRRLRSDLKTFEPLLDAAWSADLRTELRWLIDELGAVRDCDVLAAKLRDVGAVQPEVEHDAARRVLHRLSLKRRRDRRRLLEHLGDERAVELFDRLVAASAAPATVPGADRRAHEVMPRLVRKRWKRLDRAVSRLGPDPTPAELHDVRILAKRLRYAAEAVVPSAGKKARKFAKLAATIQDALGELNDAVIARAWLAAVAERLDGAAAFASGQMSQQLVNDARVEAHQWRSAHRAMSRRSAWLS